MKKQFLEVIEMLEEALDQTGYLNPDWEEMKMIEKTMGVSFKEMTENEIIAYFKGLINMYKYLKK